MDDIKKEDPKIVIYRFTSVLFGLAPSPFLLNATVSTHMEKYQQTDFETVKKFLADLYCDDSLSGSQTKAEAFEFYEKVKNLTKQAYFVRKAILTQLICKRNPY